MFEPVRWELEADVIPPPRHKFVNTKRGSCFSEISFDDLPLEFSEVKDEPHKCKLEDPQHDKDGSKTVGEVLPVDITDVSPIKTRLKETRCQPGSRFDMSKYSELQNSEQLLFDKWREQKLINSGGLSLCRNAFNF
ncbi:hypothetical protein HanIR_Chr09g0443541 [Helianthus annuus]|nr:hypothetical protein HanIR_Chr09g0443541 [Helianthus annuus]